MPRRDQVTRAAGIDKLVARAEAPALIRVRTSLVEVERHARGYGQVEHDPVPDLDLLLDVREGLRLNRELPQDMKGRRRFEENLPTSVELYDELAQDADLDLEVVIKGTAETLAIIQNVASTTTLAKGGARSLKTHTGSYWSFRQWMLRGSSSGLGWFVGPDMGVAHVLKDKWLVGEGEGVPPICPPELVLSYPTHERETDQHIYMIDGFRIRLLHAGSNGKNMPGRSVDFVQWTESAITSSGKPYARARGRVTTSKGQLYLDAVPEPRSWIRSAILDPADEEATLAADLEKRGEEPEPPEFSVHQLSSKNNPWNDQKDAESFHRALYALAPRLAKREAEGQDIGDANRIFAELFEGQRHTFDYEGWSIPEPEKGALIGGRPLIDITRRASLKRFRSQKDWIAALDINARPHTTIVGKIAIPPGLDESDADNWVLVFFDGWQDWGVDSEEAAVRLASRWDGLFARCGVVMDGTSCVKGHNAGGNLNARKGMMPREMYERTGFEVIPPTYHRGGRRKPTNPPPFSGTIVQRRMLRDNRVLWNWMRCRSAIRAIRDQEDAGDGLTPAKHSGTAQDRKVASWTEVWRYLSWPFFATAANSKRPIVVRQRA